MSKLTSLFMVCLLLFFTLTYAARPEPVLPEDSPIKSQNGDAEPEDVEINESCEGVGEEECLMRRTLVAHTDYIYTQKRKP